MKNLLLVLASISLSFGAYAQQNGACNNCPSTNKTITPLDGTGSLGMTFQKDTCGLNFVQSSVLTETRSATAGFNTNGTGFPTACAISGLPSCAVIFKAYLYYIASYQSPTAPATTVSITNPASVNGVFPANLIGTGPSKCWGETGTAVYRADVTANISGSGSYAIDLNGFQNKNWEVDGVTLFIIYRDPLATYQGSMVMWDGDITAITVVTPQTMTGFNTCAASDPGTGKAFLLLSDRQANINANQHNPVLNGITQTFPNDFWCWDQINTSFTMNQTTSNFSVEGAGGDCYTWALMGIYYQTSTCATCVAIPPSTITLNSSSTPSVCGQPNGTATTTPSGGSPPYTYVWNSVPPQTTQTATGLQPGTYIVNVVDATGCSLGTDSVIVQQLPVADTLQMTVAFCDGDTSAILYAPQGFSSYQWYNGTTMIPGANGDSIIIIPSQVGNYSVNQMINGCIRHTSVFVQIIPSPYFLPDSTANVFTPNGDGKNDIFYPYISKLYNSANIDYEAKDFSMKIYNRWGNIVYESTEYVPQWDGKINGKLAADGTYYWICTYINRCEPTKTVTQKGFVHLMK